jgi:RHS repeat-associated protein
VSETGYDEFGQRVYIKYGNDPYGNGNGVETWYKYDPARRWLTDIVTKNPRGNVTYQDISYELDAVGNVKGYSNNGDMHMTSQRYEYDDLYQLVEARGESIGHPGTGLPSYNSNYTQTFAFDSIGNMTDKTSNSLYSTVQPPGVNLNYKLQYEYLPGTHKASRIGDTYYGYDGNGNLITEQAGSPVTAASNTMRVSEEGGIYSTEYGFALRSREGGEAETGTTAYRRDYAWNERNLLQRSADRQYKVEYRYGADGQRAVKFSQGGGVAAETRYFNQMLHTSSGVTGELVSKHIYVGETRIVTKRRQAGNENYGQEYKSQYFYHGDHLGSAQLVTDSEGKVYEHLEYTPYGELWVDRSTAATGNSPTPFRFTGKEFDPETGLYYYGARYLDPKTSRWISADPAMGEYVPQAGKESNSLPNGGVYNAVNMHCYNYCNNNPIRYKDPNGRNPDTQSLDTTEVTPIAPTGAGWINPVEGNINCEYGFRDNPLNKKKKEFHASIDVSVPQGTEVLATASGTVVIGETPTFGQFVALNPESSELNPDGNIRVITSHMSQIDVENGQRVEAGSVLGLSGGARGTTGAGSSTGPHVDIMVRTDGQDTPSWAGEGQLTDNPTAYFDY